MPVLVVLRKIQRKAIPRFAQPLDLSSVSRTRYSVLRGLGQRLNKQKTICSVEAERMVFRICITDALLAIIEKSELGAIFINTATVALHLGPSSYR